MRRFAPLLVLLCAISAYAEEPKGVQCGLYAFVEEDDAGARATYDGLRKGLELAHLPRVCMEGVPQSPAEWKDFLIKVKWKGHWPLFAVGETQYGHVKNLIDVPRVVVLERYSIAGRPVVPVPSAPGIAVVYADLRAEQLRVLFEALLAGQGTTAEWAASPATEDASRHASRLSKALGLDAVGFHKSYRMLLHLRIGSGWNPWPYERAVKHARDLGIPLISDDRGRFGHGAVVTLVPRHDLLGRAAAEAARKLRQVPAPALPARAIAGLQIWVDLQAADEQGIELPLAFIAKADKLRRGKRKR